jgi:hypothetical protein
MFFYTGMITWNPHTGNEGRGELMDTVTVILGGLRVILGFLMLLFIPGFVLSLVIFPRFKDIGIDIRLVP